MPLRTMAVAGLPQPSELAGAGVRRISAGPVLFEHGFAAASRATRQFLEGDFSLSLRDGFDYGDFNRLFAH